MTSEIPEGWYADPQDPTPGAERWWNGFSWTAHERTVEPRPAGPPPGESDQPRGLPISLTPTQPGPPRRLPDGTPLADVGARIGGYVVDVVVISIVGSIVAAFLTLALELSSFAVRDFLPGPWFFWTPSLKPIVLVGLWLLYHLATRGHTFGKRAFNLRLRPWGQDGEISRSQVLRRSLVGCGGLLVVALPAGGVLGIILIGYDALRMSQHEASRAWHDELAGTVVVKALPSTDR